MRDSSSAWWAVNGEIIAPDAFLGVAERYGLIAEIDRWGVVKQAVSSSSPLGHHLAANLSAESMGGPTC